MPAYGPDVAHVHDTGHGDFARDAAPGVLALLREAGIHDGLVVDLGCGSGIWAAALTEAGYDVVGVDPDAGRAALDAVLRRIAAALRPGGAPATSDLPPSGTSYSWLHGRFRRTLRRSRGAEQADGRVR